GVWRGGGAGYRLRRRTSLPAVLRLLRGDASRRGEPPAEGAVTPSEARRRVDGYASVVFDCDSTLVRIEGIDELAGDRIDEIRRMTELAMDGAMALEEVYGERLALIDPTQTAVEAVGQAYREALVEDAQVVVDALHWLG